MRELIRSNDPVFISWVQATLAQEGIRTVVLDGHVSILEGSIGALPRRVMVVAGDFDQARHLVEVGPTPVGTMADVEPSLTEDRLLGGAIRLRQPASGFRAAIDPVLLAAAVPAKPDERVADIGCGVGAAALCLAHRVGGVRVDGLDLQRAMIELGKDNAIDNDLQDRLRFHVGDIAADARPPDPGVYDHVMTNPPFGDPDRHRHPDDPRDAMAKLTLGIDLERWLDYCVRRLHSKGMLTVIHRADCLDRILVHLSGRLGNLVVCPLWPKPGRPARRVLVSGRKGRRTPLTISPGLVLHDADGGFAESARAVLWQGRALDLTTGEVK